MSLYTRNCREMAGKRAISTRGECAHLPPSFEHPLLETVLPVRFTHAC
jgi:hypothetical protein